MAPPLETALKTVGNIAPADLRGDDQNYTPRTWQLTVNCYPTRALFTHERGIFEL
jgi:hypothetical protein